MEPALESGADAIIFDLEDALPVGMREHGRVTTARSIDQLSDGAAQCFVRINAWGSGQVLADLDAVVRPGLTGITLGKLDEVAQMAAVDLLLTDYEVRRGLIVGTIQIIFIPETARAVRNTYDICSVSARVRHVSGVTHSMPGGDFYRDLGLRWTPDGRELAYTGGKIMLDARAAGVSSLLCGPVADVANLAHLREVEERGLILGATGGIAIHPTHVPIINETFTPRAEEISAAANLLNGMAAADLDGDGAVQNAGLMVDLAHARYAADIVERGRRAGIGAALDPAVHDFLTTLGMAPVRPAGGVHGEPA